MACEVSLWRVSITVTFSFLTDASEPWLYGVKGHLECVQLSNLPCRIFFYPVRALLCLGCLFPFFLGGCKGLDVARLATHCVLSSITVLSGWMKEEGTTVSRENKWLTQPQMTKGFLGADIHLTIQWSFKEFICLKILKEESYRTSLVR